MSATEENAKENDLVLAVIIPDGELDIFRVSYTFHIFSPLLTNFSQHSLSPNNLQAQRLVVHFMFQVRYIPFSLCNFSFITSF